MTIVRKHNFQPATPISSAQVNEEFNQLINAVNNIYTKEESEEMFMEKNGLQTNKPVLYSNWAHRSEFPVNFIKTQEGLVHLVGSCINGLKTRPNLICYIPDGYLPATVVYAEVGSTGLIKLQGNRMEIERELPNAEIFFNLTYKVQA